MSEVTLAEAALEIATLAGALPDVADPTPPAAPPADQAAGELPAEPLRPDGSVAPLAPTQPPATAEPSPIAGLPAKTLAPAQPSAAVPAGVIANASGRPAAGDPPRGPGHGGSPFPAGAPVAPPAQEGYSDNSVFMRELSSLSDDPESDAPVVTRLVVPLTEQRRKRKFWSR